MMRKADKEIVLAPHLAKFVRGVTPEREPLPPRTVRVTRTMRPSATWDELHLRGLEPAREEDPVWLMDFGGRIPGSCNCRRHWLAVLDQFPPRFTDFFAWSVDAHNAVNRHLDKPQLELEAARAIWTARRDELNAQLNLKAS